MESAALTKAHEHVRTAATATYDNRVATAGQEHDYAASAFHEAVNDTHNAEALRILSLLEDHHRKLAGLIKEAPRKEKQNTAGQTSDAAAKPAASNKATSKGTSAASSPAPTSRRRLPQSSIASNLAEKRGIPTARRTTSGTAVNIAGAIGSREEQGATPVRDLLAQQSRRAEASKLKDAPTAQKEPPNPRPASPPAEDNFRRFYSAFGGVISAISAPLAFTSLPLNPAASTPAPEPPKEEKTSKTKPRTRSPEASRSVKSSVPDLASLISKPALRALREDGSAPLGPNESFYLVPGTASYASILQNKRDAQNAALNPIEEGSGSMKGSSHEEFVDARENVGPPSPTKARHARTRSGSGVTPQRSIPAGRGAGLKTMEELALENETLKTVIDKQAKRIQMWELNSQNSFNALAQSFRARGPGRMSSDPNALAHALSQGSGAVPALPSPPMPNSQPTSPGLAPPRDADTARRIADLEAMLANQTAKVHDLMSNNEHLAKQNEKNSQVIGRYREQWEKLKAGARKKEQERKERRVLEVKAGEVAKDSESGDAAEEVEGEGDVELDEPGFGKA
ncbi:hypothetical protein BKA63DRAFT_164371 [Paraphoma chrysanthemicola]|nr:hypothetical protein BKA63DRAFT_164371 [Paraphoma chrysanthemicola]